MASMLIVTVAGAVVVACARDRSSARRRRTDAPRPSAAGRVRRRLNLLLVTLDTTRPTEWARTARPPAATPASIGSRGRASCFQHAVTAVPLTLPAHATIFTAAIRRHGVRDNGGFFLDAKNALAERLKAKRLQRPAASSAPYVLDRRWGIAQGFDTYVDDFDVTDAKAGWPAWSGRRQRGRRPRARVARTGGLVTLASDGCISTTRTPRTIRRNPIGRACSGILMLAR